MAEDHKIINEIRGIFEEHKASFDLSWKEKFDEHILIFRENFNMAMEANKKTRDDLIAHEIKCQRNFDNLANAVNPIVTFLENLNGTKKLWVPVFGFFIAFLSTITIFVGAAFAIKNFIAIYIK